MLDYEPKIIKNEEDYEDAIRALDELMDKDFLSQEEDDLIELLAHLIEEYEKQKYPFPPPDPIEAIKFRMEQEGLQQKDLIPYMGDKTQVSLILNGKKPLTLEMIRTLHDGLHIPLESLVAESTKRMLTKIADIDWNKFPIKKMFEQNREVFFQGIKKSLTEIRNNVEYNIKHLFEPYKDILFSGSLLRQNPRMSGKCDNYALTAWLAAICRLADEEILANEFESDKQEIIVNQLRMVSIFDEGPRLAREFLKRVGIHLIILKHLPKTYLDGVSFMLRDNFPVIGLTLRYDRIDYFWFTLFHELGHVFEHLSHGEQKPIFDNLEIQANSNIEKEADTFAEENLIPNEEIKEAGLFNDHDPNRIIDFANEKQVNPAIVAGRIRKHHNNYYILNRMVGNGKVRNQFNY